MIVQDRRFGFCVTSVTMLPFGCGGGAFSRRLCLLLALAVLLSSAGDSLAAWTDNQMLHNSNRFTGTTKWGGKWGTDDPAAKYGPIDCSTCHEKNAANIKRVRQTITAPKVTDQFPIQADPTPPAGGVSFQDVREGSSHFGDDANRGGDTTQSNRICEVCHSQTTVHNYNVANNTDGTSHYNQADCIACHKHNSGFKPLACDACHGYPPTANTPGSSAPTTGLAYDPRTTGSATAGAHALHYGTLGYACTNCHNNYVMPVVSSVKPGFSDISIGFSNFGATTGSYTGQAGISYNNVLGTGGLTCTTVYCHGSTLDGTDTTPVWNDGTGSVACGECHKGTNAAMAATALGSHAKHAGNGAGQLNLTCSKCHATPGGAGHVTGTVAWDLDQTDPRFGATAAYRGADNGATAGLAPSGTYGSCASVYCHSIGNLNAGGAVVTAGGAQYRTVIWGGGAVGCDKCHGDLGGKTHPAYATGAVASDTANSHVKHVEGSALSCDYCHVTTTTDTTIPPATVLNGGQHLDRTEDVSFKTNGGKTGTYNADKTCSATYCHGTAASVAWGGTTNCASCHGASNNGDLSVSGSTGHAIHYASATAPAAMTDGDAHTTTAYAYACQNCHPTATHSTGPATALRDAQVGGTKVAAYTEGGASSTDPKGFKYTADGTCATLCHTRDGATAGSAIVAAVWNGAKTTPNCGVCHSKAGDASPTWSAPHTKHINTYSANTNLSCSSCHNTTAASNTAINNTVAARNQHPNQVKNVDFNAWSGGSWASSQCSNTYCHSNGVSGTHAPISWSSTTTCTSCHGGGGATITTLSASHLVHIGNGVTDANKQFNLSCDVCHSTTASNSTTLNVTTGTTQHVNKSKEVVVLAANGGTGTNGGDFGGSSCATTNCHGSASPAWATGATNGNCSACHGMAAVSAGPAPPAGDVTSSATMRDTNGDTAATDAQVGAHAIHLNPTFSKAVTCDQCHLTTVTNMNAAATYVGMVNAVGHIDSAGTAELTWGGVADGNNDGQSPATAAPVSCATTYCHDRSKIKNAWGGTGAVVPVWTDTAFIGGTSADCDNCHGYPPAGSHVANTDCSACHDVLNADDVTFTAAGKLTHVDGIVQASGGDSCTDCHAADIDNALNGVHAKHAATATYLSGKTISGGGYGGAGWYTTVYVSGKPNYGCGECHPAAEGVSHPLNGLNVDLDPAGETPTAGSIKLKNTNSPSTPTYTSRVSVTCNNIYCHSDAAATPTYQLSPNWYGGTVSGNCTDCHGNSPTTGTHNWHEVGIHYKTLYDDDGDGLMPAGAAPGTDAGAAHGNTATADTIGCQICHNSTVSVEYNAANTVCGTCHSDTNAPVTGNEKAIISTLGSTHVNGLPDVAFASLSSFKSKSQLRNDITTVTALNSSWTRTNSYKAAAGTSHDAGKNVTPTWNSGAKTCSTVDCHNGIVTPAWNAGSSANCLACHTTLPQ